VVGSRARHVVPAPHPERPPTADTHGALYGDFVIAKPPTHPVGAGRVSENRVWKDPDPVVIQSDGLHLDIWSNAYLPGIGWDTARPIDPNRQEAGRVQGADIAIDPNGNGVAVWKRDDPDLQRPGGTVWAARYE
jgi:hypothetical protein